MSSSGFVVGLSVLGACTGSFLYLAPFKTILQIQRAKDSMGISALPLLFLGINSLLWCAYGLIAHDFIIFWLNAVYCSLTLHSFMIIFAYEDSKARSLTVMHISVCAILGTIGLVSFAAQGEISLDVMGMLASAIVCCVYGSPIQNVVKAFREKSVVTIPLPMGLASAMNGTLWTFYGILTNQPYVAWPNSVGSVIGTVQVVSYLLLRRAAAKQQGGQPISGSHFRLEEELPDEVRNSESISGSVENDNL